MSASPPTAGALVLVPNTLDFGAAEPLALASALPHAVIERAAQLTHWLVEDAKTARAFLKRVAAIAPLGRPLQELQIRELPRDVSKAATPAMRRRAIDNDPKAGPPAGADLAELLAPARTGVDIGLLSEAGLPGVADPGAAVVLAGHRLGLRIEALPGPSALMLALAASGLNGQQFAFVGYLPVKDDARAARIRELDALSRRTGQTQIAIETPYRNPALLRALIEHLQPGTLLAVACALGWPQGWNRTQSVQQWRRSAASIDSRLPAVFAWLAR